MKNPIMRRILIVLLVVYAALQIYAITAIASRFWIGMIFTSLSTVVAFIFALLHAGWRMGWRKALLLLGLSFGISLAYESIGVATGYVYGPYHYTDRLGPKFLGLVPI